MALIDMRMPGLNGYETYIKIKKIIPSIKAYIMTAFADEDLIKEAINHGVLGVFYKPLEIMRLIETLKMDLGVQD